ncbi:MAG: hypothetical protein NXI09_15565 [Bacteroidetes bacterium]|nr:hypothetical protein [Bacteroidota bacterium]
MKNARLLSLILLCAFTISQPRSLIVDCSTFSLEVYNNIYKDTLIEKLVIKECSEINKLPYRIEEMDLRSLHFYWVGNGSDSIDYAPIGNISSLEELVLGPYGSISVFPSTFRNLKNLKIIDLRLTDVKKIPNWIYYMEKLEEINISMTEVSDLPINSLKRLKHLMVVNIEDSNVTEDYLKDNYVVQKLEGVKIIGP